MRKAWIVLLACVIFSCAPLCHAAEEDAIPEVDIEIPEEIAEYISPEIFAWGAEEMISSFTFDNLLKTALSAAEKIFPEIMTAFLGTLGLIVVSAVMAALRGSVASSTFGALLEYVSVLCTASAVFSFISSLFAEFEAFISQINSFVLALIPALSAVMLACGQATGSAVFGTVLSGAVTLLEALCTSLLLPMISALL